MTLLGALLALSIKEPPHPQSMHCHNCQHEFKAADVATIGDSDPNRDNVELQVRCPQCDALHYTFVPEEDLTSNF